MAEIKRILSLGTKEFLTGIAQSSHAASMGVLIFSRGISPFAWPNLSSSTDVGLLEAMGTPTNLTSTVVVDTPIASVNRVTAASTGKCYILGGSGHFYDLNINTLAVPSDLRSGTPITNPANGIAIYKPNGGTEYLFYWQKTQIGRWDLSGSYPTGWTDNHFTGLQSTDYHPVHSFASDVYYGNLDRVGKIYDNAGTAANNTNVLDFPSDYTITCLEDDGTYLIAGITKNKGDATFAAETKVIFWDTFSPTWNFEWVIPDNTINALKRVGTVIYAFGGRAIYAFNLNTSPVALLADISFTDYANANAVAQYNEAILWGQENSIHSFGKFVPDVPTAYFTPFASGLSVKLLNFVKNNILLVGTSEPKLGYFDLTNQNNGTATRTMQTIFFDLKDVYDLKRIDIVFGQALASGDGVSVTVYVDATVDTGTTWGTARFSNLGAVKRAEIPPTSNIRTDQFSLEIDIESLLTKIKRIDVYGERVSTI